MSSFGRLRSANHLDRTLLRDGWQFCRVDAGQLLTPTALHAASLSWCETTVPATAASSLRQLGQWSLDSQPQDFDASDWWYRLRFNADARRADESIQLCFGGLATVADVWLNDSLLLHSDNMFRRHDCDVGALLRSSNDLLIRFGAIAPQLAQKRPRPRWKAPMIQHQQLRWLRTTLLGRTPGWSPPAAAIGPWRSIWLERQCDLHIDKLVARATLKEDIGTLEFSCRIAPLKKNLTLPDCRLTLQRNEHSFTTQLNSNGDDRYHGTITIVSPDKWWPHTHGEPALYKLDLHVVAAAEATQTITVDLGRVGFRNVRVDTDNDNFAVTINGSPIFCRGACWMPQDVVSLQNNSVQLQSDIALVRDAGMNMLRMSGTTVYEDDEFLDLCDANGILLWQDFMFANMDYPETPEFIDEVRHEVSEQVARLSDRPCLTVLCGNSEGEQQAAMFGATRDRWSPKLFHQLIPEWLAQLDCGVAYWPSSAHGGAFPHQNNAGSTSYYGVGAYLRPLDDARRSGVRFASECLAFANVPDDSSLQQMPNGIALKTHHPQWKARTPRDLGAGWDFEDVRDHYLQLLFKVDPTQLRYADHERYLALSRATTGEVMAATFLEWRSQLSSCHGGLVWFLRDLWHGAGWGILDADGVPKAAYHYLRRALQPTAVGISDEGCNGLYIHMINEQPTTVIGRLEVAWYKHSETLVTKASLDVELQAHSRQQLPMLQLLDYFTDINHAYRFGPALCDVVVASLYDAKSNLLSENFYWPHGLPASQHLAPQLTATAEPDANSDGDVLLTVHSDKLAYGVCIAMNGYRCEDQYFHIAPDASRVIRATRTNANAVAAGRVQALNSARSVDIVQQQSC
jgi:beta-mannosidase